MKYPTHLSRFGALFALLLAAVPAGGAPVMWVGPTITPPGTTATTTVNLLTDTNVVKLQFDLLYDTNYLTSSTPTGGDALADHILLTSEPTPGLRRVQLFSFSNSAMTNGVVVFIPFTIARGAPSLDVPLILTNVTATNAINQQIPIGYLNGAMRIVLPPVFTAISRTTNGAIHLEIAAATGRSYILLATPNVEPPNWVALYTNRPPTGRITFDDTKASAFMRRFYRVEVAL